MRHLANLWIQKFVEVEVVRTADPDVVTVIARGLYDNGEVVKRLVSTQNTSATTTPGSVVGTQLNALYAAANA